MLVVYREVAIAGTVLVGLIEIEAGRLTLSSIVEIEMLERAVGEVEPLERAIAELLIAGTDEVKQVSPFSGRHLSLLPFLPLSGIAAPAAMAPKARIAVIIAERIIELLKVGMGLCFAAKEKRRQK